MLSGGVVGEAATGSQPEAGLKDDDPQNNGGPEQAGTVAAALLHAAAPQAPLDGERSSGAEPGEPTVSISAAPMSAELPSEAIKSRKGLAPFEAERAVKQSTLDVWSRPLSLRPAQALQEEPLELPLATETSDIQSGVTDRRDQTPSAYLPKEVELPRAQVGPLGKPVAPPVQQVVGIDFDLTQPAEPQHPALSQRVDLPTAEPSVKEGMKPSTPAVEQLMPRTVLPLPQHVKRQAQVRAFAFQELGWFDRVAVADAPASQVAEPVAFEPYVRAGSPTPGGTRAPSGEFAETEAANAPTASSVTDAAGPRLVASGAPVMRTIHGRPLAATLAPERAARTGPATQDVDEEAVGGLRLNRPEPLTRPPSQPGAGPSVTVFGEAGGPLEVMAFLPEFTGGESSRLRDAAADVLSEFNADLGGFSLNGAKVGVARVR